jgi:hypothetical protein
MKKLFVISLIVSFSCQNDNYIKEYYANGKLKMECEISDGMKHGKMIEYYPNGNILSLSNWINDTINGYSTGYYESGNIEFISTWVNGELYGDYVKYDETGYLQHTKNYYFNNVKGYESIYDNGSLKQMNQYVIVSDSSFLNQYINYDDFGNIKKESSQFYMVIYGGNNDTVLLNKPVELRLLVTRIISLNHETQLKFIPNKHDISFNFNGGQNMDTISVNGYNNIDLTFSFYKTGWQNINGVILLSYTDPFNVLKQERMYFGKYFYVKE